MGRIGPPGAKRAVTASGDVPAVESDGCVDDAVVVEQALRTGYRNYCTSGSTTSTPGTSVSLDPPFSL
jgi:hypothetical protein